MQVKQRDIPKVGISVLGPLSLDERRSVGRRDRIVLSALVLQHGHPVSADLLTDVLWPDGPPASASKVVQGCIVRLRAELGPESIRTTEHGYLLGETGKDLDVVKFEEGVARGRELIALGQYDRAAYTFAEALELWRGRPYPDLESWDVAAIETARLQELRLQAEELRVEAVLGSGDHDAALVMAQPLAAEAPLRERRWMLLAMAAYRAGRQNDALQALRRCREMLRDELGIDPSLEVTELEHAILSQDPGLLEVEQAPPEADTCPWLGLSSYDADDAAMFFGRESEIASAMTQLRGRGVLAVVGPSGVGKSSFVRAGVAATCAREGMTVAIITPGAHPPDRLPRADLLVVDQCEEVFTLCTDARRRGSFLAALETHARGGLLVLALRADRMSDVAANPELARLIERGLYLLGGLTAAGLRAAIEKPVAQAGLRIEPGLVDLLLRDLEGEPGALPLLSHALVETWVRREGRTLTVDGYRESGGVRGAVAQSAEDVYTQLDPGQQDALRALMLRLVSAGPAGEPLRARVPRRLVSVDADQDRLVEVLVGSRLVTSDDDSVTLAHEALARAWPRLQDWLQEDVEGRRTLHHLASAAEAWESLDRPDSELYRGVRLARALEWHDRTWVELSEEEQAFLDASAQLADAEQRAAEDEARRQVRTNRRLRVLVVALVLLLVGAAAAGAVALRQTREADQQALAADTRRVGARALLEDDPATSLLLAAAADRLDPSDDTLGNLQAAIARHPSLIGTAPVATEARLGDVEVADDTAGLFVLDNAHLVHRYGVESFQPEASYQAGLDEPEFWDPSMAYSTRAHLLAVSATTGSARAVRLLDPVSLRPAPVQLPGLPTHVVSVDGVATSADGRYLAAVLTTPYVTASDSGLKSAVAIVWDLMADDRRMVHRIRVEAPFYSGVALSPHGDTMYLSNPVRALDLRTGRPLWVRGGDDFNLQIEAQPTGRLVAVIGGDTTSVMLVDADSGRVRGRLPGFTSQIAHLAFSHDGRLVAASGRDLIVVWDARSGELLQRIQADSVVTALTFAKDDETLYAVASDHAQLQAWDVNGYQSFTRRVPIDRSPIEGGLLSEMVRPDHQARRFTYTGRVSEEEPILAVADTGTGEVTTLPRMQMPSAGAGSWSPDDGEYAAGYLAGWVQTFDVASRTQLARAKVLPAAITEVSYFPDARHLAVASDQGHVAMVDANTLESAGKKVRLPGNVYSIAAGPDGHTVFAVAGGPESRPYWAEPIRNWYLVDLTSGRVVDQGNTGLQSAISTAFSPDGRHIAVSGYAGEVVVIDLDTGRPVRPPVVGHQGDSYLITYNSDGSLMASGSTGHDAALWDADSGELLATSALPSNEGLSVTGFRPDGTLTIGTFNGHAYRWDPSRQAALDYACRVAGRDLTRQEWEDAFGDRSYRETCPG